MYMSILSWTVYLLTLTVTLISDCYATTRWSMYMCTERGWFSWSKSIIEFCSSETAIAELTIVDWNFGHDLPLSINTNWTRRHTTACVHVLRRNALPIPAGPVQGQLCTVFYKYKCNNRPPHYCRFCSLCLINTHRTYMYINSVADSAAGSAHMITAPWRHHPAWHHHDKRCHVQHPDSFHNPKSLCICVL